MKTLVIDASPRKKNSRSLKAYQQYISKYNIKIDTYLDLYSQEIPFVNEQLLNDRFNKTTNSKSIELQNKYIEQLKQHDQLIFIFPTYNNSIPAILKAYIDLIMVSNITFKYDKFKLVGLLTNKKTIVFNTTGGPQYDFITMGLFKIPSTKFYVKKTLSNIGLTDLRYVNIDKTSYKFKNSDDPDKSMKQYIDTKIKKLDGYFK